MSRDYYRDDDDIYPYEFVEDQDEINDLEIPDVRRKDDLDKIPDHDLKLSEIEEAKKFRNEERALRESLENGDISLGMYESIIRPKMRKAATRSGLGSVGLTYDDLGDLSEDAEFLASGDLKMPELKDRLKSTIANIGPDAAQKLADRLHEEEALSKDTHDRISRQVRIHRRRNKQ